jgi:hypothetical protein
MIEYYLEQIRSKEQIDDELFEFFKKSGEKVAAVYENVFNWKHFHLLQYAIQHRFIICRRKGKPVGVHLSRLYPSILDPEIKILYQDLLFAEPGTRASIILLKDFLTFGKANADHVITCIGAKTNIKRQSLEKLGFKKMEELYRIEVIK